MLLCIEVMRAIAAAFILNSHCDGVYPIELAIGGEFGLAIFFLLTGYLSANITRETPFIKWFTKRALRIYLSIWVWDLGLMLCGQLDVGSFVDIIRIFIYPTKQWFASFIIVVYVLIFVLNKYVYQTSSTKPICVTIGVLVALYFTIYCFMDNSVPHNSTMTWHTRILWMVCVLGGILIRKKGIIENANKHNTGGGYMLLFVFLMMLYGMEKILYAFRLLLPIQFLCLIFPISAAIILFIFMGLKENRLVGIKEHPLVFRVVEWFSKASFEIYIVQFSIISLFRNFVFPVNLILIIIATVACGNIVRKSTDILIKRISDHSEKMFSYQ